MPRSPKAGVRRLGWFTLAAVLALAVVSGANPPAAAPPPAPATSKTVSAAPSSQATESPFDEPLRLIADARKAYQEVKDYRCTFIKREYLGGRLQAENVVAMQVRVKPFSVFLDWKAPRDLVGQQACYVAGRNEGMMRVQPTGAAGLLGFMSIDPKDPRVLENSRHAITEAGFGNLIERFGHCYEAARKQGKAEVRIALYEYNRRPCTRIETTYTDPKSAADGIGRSVLYLDKETHMPVRCECYDFPRGGAHEGELLEVYSYVNVQLNVGLTEEVFKH
ncbi:MAG TPA: DUF1571 domain-containing protein [Gemmataceae bacterium]|jgi:hypothetical protein